jgi:hypothetical protein
MTRGGLTADDETEEQKQFMTQTRNRMTRLPQK